MEGCIVRMVDRIAYAGRDLEDGIRAGLINQKDIPKDITDILGKNNGKFVNKLLKDLVNESEKNGTVCLSEDKHEALAKLIDFNYDNIYESSKVEHYKSHATAALNILFDQLCDNLNKSDRLKNRENLPETDVYETLSQFITDVKYSMNEKNEDIVFDFIAGMTDNYVIHCLDGIFKPMAII